MSTAGGTIFQQQRGPERGQSLVLVAHTTAIERSLDALCSDVVGVSWDALCFVNYFSDLLSAPLRAALLPTGRLPLKPSNITRSPPLLDEKRRSEER